MELGVGRVTLGVADADGPGPWRVGARLPGISLRRRFLSLTPRGILRRCHEALRATDRTDRPLRFRRLEVIVGILAAGRAPSLDEV